MIIAKNLCRLRKSQTSGGRSRSSQVMRQSSSMWQSASTGPSRNACSSAESFAGGKARSFCQSGLPLKSSPSHHTSPASIASRSVAERLGSARRAKPKMGLVIQSRRKEGSLMLPSIAAQRERKCVRSRSTLRCVSNHEGETQWLVLILRDAHARARLRDFLNLRAPQDEDGHGARGWSHHTALLIPLASRVIPGRGRSPRARNPYPPVRGYGFRPSPLSRLGRNDELKELTSDNTPSFPRRVFAPGV